MIKRNIVVIGASAGGFEALKKIVASLPSDFQAPIFIVWHMSPDVRGILPEIFNQLNSIPAINASDGDKILPNRIYVAPPDHHLLIDEGFVRVTHGPKENRFRPAVDPLFRSAAYTYGNRVIGVILSGGLDDGTAGMWRIKFSGGLTIVQDPADAEVPSMPESTLREVQVDHCVPIHEVASLLVKLTSQDIQRESVSMRDNKTKIEINIAAENNAFKNGSMDIGSPSPFACPECHGVLLKIMDDHITRFRCHTGHAYSSDTLMTALSEKIEDSLYGAIRGMDESILLLNSFGDRFAENNQLQQAAVYFRKAKEIQEHSVVIRKAVQSHELLSKNKLNQEADGDL